ncbi:MAG: hypothetical protein KKF89_00015 [Nanoarchaeota archaeon]|nr:hypothetical protein [Nanoarchaeota archaeon]
MDTKLELTLLSMGYNPQPGEISLEEVGTFIKKEIFPCKMKKPGAILLDGEANIAIQIGKYYDEITDYSFLISGDQHQTGLMISDVKKGFEGNQKVYVVQGGEFRFVVIPDQYPLNTQKALKLNFQDDNDEITGKMNICLYDNTKALYLVDMSSAIDTQAVFWNCIAKAYNLDMTHSHKSKFSDSKNANWCAATDEKSGVKLTFGTIDYYTITAEFSSEKSAKELQALVSGLGVDSQRINDISKAGTSCVMCFNNSQTYQIVDFMDRILK